MKKIMFPFVLLVFIAGGCGSKKTGPDVSDIKIDVAIQRFDREFLAIDTNNVWRDLSALNRKYPSVTGIFLQNILGLDSASAEEGVRRFIFLSKNLFDTVNTIFKNTDKVKQDFKSAFQYLKYYFPSYKLPHLITIAGPVDAMAQGDTGPTPNFLGPDFLGISLQFYLGASFSVYKDPFFIESVAPEYRSRRFSKEYIIADAMQLIVNDLFPDKSGSRPLIEQMIEKGKRWYLLDKFLPNVPDSIKTGYTKKQLDWSKQNEGLIWTSLIKNEDLQSLTPSVIQTYIGEGPFTQGFSQELSPGGLGRWIGWQIVKKYESKNSDISPGELMKTDPKVILEEAKYKPK